MQAPDTTDYNRAQRHVTQFSLNTKLSALWMEVAVCGDLPPGWRNYNSPEDGLLILRPLLRFTMEWKSDRFRYFHKTKFCCNVSKTWGSAQTDFHPKFSSESDKSRTGAGVCHAWCQSPKKSAECQSIFLPPAEEVTACLVEVSKGRYHQLLHRAHLSHTSGVGIAPVHG